MLNKNRVVRLTAFVFATLLFVTLISFTGSADSIAFGINNDTESEQDIGTNSDVDANNPDGEAVQETNPIGEDTQGDSINNDVNKDAAPDGDGKSPTNNTTIQKQRNTLGTGQEEGTEGTATKIEETVELMLGESTLLTPDYYTEDINDYLEWDTSDDGIASITPDGYLETLALGHCDVTATSVVTGDSFVYHVLVYETIENCSVELEYTSSAYTGKSLKPAVTVTDVNGERVSSDYYTVSYENNIKVGTATVTVTGNDVFSGSTTMTFRITQKLSNCTVSLSYYSKEYTGKALEPKVTVKDPAGAIVPNKYYIVSYKNNTKIGTATVTVTGGKFYTGSTSKTFKIIQNLSKCKVKLAYSSKVYTGKQLKPAVTVTDSTGAKVSSKYYTVTYKKNTAIGKATVTVKGNTLFTGSKSTSFTIKPQKGVVKKVTPSDRVATVSAKTLKGGVKYQVQFKKAGTSAWKSIKIGNKTWTKIKRLKNNKYYYFRVRAYKVSGGKTYYGAWSKSKKILIGIPISKCTIKGIKNKTYNGKKQTQDVKVYYKGKRVKAKVTYGDRTKIGRRYVVVHGVGKFAGTVKRTYLIKPGKTRITGMIPYAWYEYSMEIDEPYYLYYNNNSIDDQCGYYIMAVDLACSRVAGGVYYEFAFKDEGQPWLYGRYGTSRYVYFYDYPKNKKIYAKVRAYKWVDGEKICGPWSSVQAETTHYKKVRLSNYYEKSSKYIRGTIYGGYKGEIITLKIGNKTYTKKVTKNGNTTFKFYVGRIKAGTGYKVILQTKFKEDIYTYSDTAWYAAKVKNGMTKNQVKYTWGLPDDTASSSGGWTYWYYDDGSFVHFKNGKVKYWYEE